MRVFWREEGKGKECDFGFGRAAIYIDVHDERKHPGS